MDADKLRDVMRTALPRVKVLAFARKVGAMQRQSLIELDGLVNALVLTARTPSGGRQADVMRAYMKATGTEPVRGAFYLRFNEGLEALLEGLLRDALDAAQRDRVLLPACLGGVRDWVAIDSETVQLHQSLKGVYPGTGDYAAVKVHKAYSIGRHNLIDYELSPARDHDSKRFKVTAAMRGVGLLMDLGYASHERLRDCKEHGVSFVIKLKSRWKARIQDVHEGEVNDLFAGTDFAEALKLGKLRCEDGRLDVDVTLGHGKSAYTLRLVAVETPEHALCVFLTNLPRERYPVESIAQLYRLRWEIEKSNKLDKSDFCLDDLDCRKPCSARTMLYASLLGSSIAGRLVHADHCALVDTGKPITRGPMHVRLVAMAIASMHVSITEALDEDRPKAWQRLASTIRHLSCDPNWRRRPSVLDQLLGFTAAPGRPRRQKTVENATRVAENDHMAASK